MLELFKKCNKCHEEKLASEFTCSICKSCQFGLSEIKEKRCNKCKEIKLINNFTNFAASLDGYSFYCKECIKNHNRRKYLENPDLYKKRSMDWQKNNKNKYNEIRRKSKKKFLKAMIKEPGSQNLYFNSQNNKYYGFTEVRTKSKKKSFGIVTLEEAKIKLKQWMIDIRKPSFHENQKSGQYFGGKPL